MKTASFWQGFLKKAECSCGDQKKGPPPLLARSVSKAGPKLSDLTEESDRNRFDT